VLRGGTCAAANCSSGSSVVPGLGACLSELVLVPTGSGSSALPTITGISAPTTATTRQPLSWWEILLMALGCAFIFVAFLYCWRRRARKQRAKETAAFAVAKSLDHKTSWRLRLARFGERLFGHSSKQPRPDTEELSLWKLRAAEEARHDRELDKLIGAYEYSRAGSNGAPSVFDHKHGESHDNDSYHSPRGSMYSQMTGMPLRGPEPRQPVKTNPLTSRFSTSTLGSSVYKKKPSALSRRPSPPRLETDAQAYAASVQQSAQSTGGSSWVTPTNTGGSRNPFRTLA